jgi:hypothetical protein
MPVVEHRRPGDEEGVDRRQGEQYDHHDEEHLAQQIYLSIVIPGGWLGSEEGVELGLFGASTGAAAALVTAADRAEVVRAVVSRGGRPDLAANWPAANASKRARLPVPRPRWARGR